MTGRTVSWALQESCDLLAAIEAGDLVVEYQRVIDLRDGAAVNAEALVRWRQRGVVLPPAQFLHLAAHPAIGSTLALFVLDEALGACSHWRLEGEPTVGVCVNVSPTDLVDRRVAAGLPALFARHGVDPWTLTIELTERRSPEDPVALRRGMVALARLGVRLSIDDFGTGESSLLRLRTQHFDELKIDQSFVRELASDPADQAIVECTARLAHHLGMVVVAEGAEHADVLPLLAELGVDLVQGYALHRPGPVERLFNA